MSEPVRYIVESIRSEFEQMFCDLGIMEGDAIEVPDGFPSEVDQPYPGEPVTLNRELHPNIAWFLGDMVDSDTVKIRRVTSDSSEKEVSS